ncbi:hypothetical protein ACH5RR_024653 [Cinchona calisaya]|uniref:KIB1-4 beta-propeller domain-containing protein n=1 Tax=Cinchona calisaya TaxID=153742 RepID=A0ABD2YY80_9GENT
MAAGCSSRPPSPRPYPLLMYCHGKSSTIQTFYSVKEDSYYMRKLPDLNDKVICGGCEGWLVVLNTDAESDECFLINLASTEKIKLPPFKDFDIKKCVITAPPTDPTNCILVFFDSEKPDAMFWRPGQKNWIKQDNIDDGSQKEEDELWRLNHLTGCGSKIYGFTNYSKLVVAEVVNHRLRLRPLGPYRPEMPIVAIRFYLNMVESRGEIFLVYRSMLGESDTRIEMIQVYKLNNNSNTINQNENQQQPEWIQVKDIGDRVFFFNTHTYKSFACSASETGLKRNSIYFTCCHDYNKNLYLFDLEENSIQVSLPCPNVVHNMTHTLWVMLKLPPPS